MLYCIAIYFIVLHIVFFQNSNINNCIVEKKIWQYKNNDIFPCPACYHIYFFDLYSCFLTLYITQASQ